MTFFLPNLMQVVMCDFKNSSNIPRAHAGIMAFNNPRCSFLITSLAINFFRRKKFHYARQAALTASFFTEVKKASLTVRPHC